MKSSSLFHLGLLLGAAVLVQCGIASNLAAADHGHLNAGAAGTNQDDALLWANGADFVASAGYVKTLSFTNGGTYAGYYQQNITLTALPTTAAHAGPDPLAPAPGSFIAARMACLEAPVDGKFSFWEAGATSPTITVGAGDASTNRWILSQNNGVPGTDPYGHIHGRRFTGSKPGLYKIAFQAVDVSTNGAHGGPLHTPSEELPVYFQAGFNLVSIEPDYEEGHVHIRFAAQLGWTWQVEFLDPLNPAAGWRPAGSSLIGDDVFVETVHEGDPGEHRLYRVGGTPIRP